jgi:hypothetical protein
MATSCIGASLYGITVHRPFLHPVGCDHMVGVMPRAPRRPGFCALITPSPGEVTRLALAMRMDNKPLGWSTMLQAKYVKNWTPDKVADVSAPWFPQ